MITQFFGQEIFKKLAKASATSLQLAAGTKVLVGGNGVELKSDLSCDLSSNGLGGLDVGSLTLHEKYYVYMVISGVNFGLVASLSPTGPSGFLAYRKVGLFYTSSISEVIETINFGSLGRNITCQVELTSPQNVPTSVNHFVVWDEATEDTADIWNGNTGIDIPEDGYYEMSGMATPFNLIAEFHQVKIRTATHANVGVNYFDIPVANGNTPQPVPNVERFLLKGDEVLMNVDASADTNYDLKDANGTYLRVSKKAAPDDIDWT